MPGNIPRHAQSPGEYSQNPKDGSQLGITLEVLIVLPCNTLQNLKGLAQTMQKVMHINYFRPLN
jgi:hypothetical protein